jgi:pimeloyl-ACP methyl ester carboxylesterase
MKTEALSIPTTQERPLVRWAHKSTNVRLFHSYDVRRASFQLLSLFAPGTAARVAAKLFLTPPPPRPLSGKAQALFAKASDRFTVKLETSFGDRDETSRVSVALWGRGPAVYLLHGWGGRGASCASFVEPLIEAGFTAVAIDAPGHGESPAPRTSILHFAAALSAVVESVGPARALVGHSLGGAASSFAMRRGLASDRVVFVGAPAQPAEFFDVFLGRLGIPERLHAPIRAGVERDYGFGWDDLRVAAPEKAPFGGADVPALVVHDVDDAEVDYTNAGRIADAWPGAELVTTHGLGHHRVLRDRDVVRRVVSWLSTTGPSR